MADEPVPLLEYLESGTSITQDSKNDQHVETDHGSRTIEWRS